MTADSTRLIEKVSGNIALTSVREKIESLENEWKKLPQVEIPVVHRYSGGIYAREIVIPADTFLTGKIYKDDHFDIMVYGDVTVSSDEGVKRMSGFHAFESKSGKKRAGYTHSETKWITMCFCPPMADDDYIGYLTCASFKDYELEMDRRDYLSVLCEYGFTEEQARTMSVNESDYVIIDSGDVYVDESDIEGEGLFSTAPIKTGDVIINARVDGMRTIGGKYTNHSRNPNAKMVMLDSGDIDLVAIKNIENEEITCDYRVSLSLQIKRKK